MAGEEITIDVAPNGDVKVEGHNIKGADCKTLTTEIERALGAVVSTVKKPEFHQNAGALTRKH